MRAGKLRIPVMSIKIVGKSEAVQRRSRIVTDRERLSIGSPQMPNELDITPLRSLIAVADTGGFHRAAAALQLSQSAVSQHVRRLERVLGRPLVEPDGRRARLTPSGRT